MNFVNNVLTCNVLTSPGSPWPRTGTKRKTLALSSDDEGNRSGILSEGDDDVPLFTPGKKGPTTPPSAAKAPVRKEDPLQVIQEIIGGWQLVRVKLTREEMRTLYGGVCPETSEEEDWDPEPDYLVTGEVKPYINRSQDDGTENLRLFLLRSATLGANDARHAAGALGTQTIRFTSYSDKQ